MYELVARKALSWNESNNVGLVVGATLPKELGGIRQIIGNDIPLLIPGVGAQGGDVAAAVRNGTDDSGELAIINVSRSILYASDGRDFARRARQEAVRVNEQIDRARSEDR